MTQIPLGQPKEPDIYSYGFGKGLTRDVNGNEWRDLSVLKRPGDTSLSEVRLAENVKFGGDGSDGILDITSGTTTLDAANADILTKNYRSISITGTGKLAFSSPGTNGTIITLKSKGDITITSTAPAIDCSALGATIVTAGLGTVLPTNVSSSGTAPTKGAGGTAVVYFLQTTGKLIRVSCGSGGGNGGTSDTTGGAGGRGGGALIIECGGRMIFNGTISVAGQNGNNGGAGSGSGGGGGGGGGGGVCAILYNELTSNSGTIIVTGGNGGNGKSGQGSSSTAGGGGGGGGSNRNAGGDGGNGGNSGVGAGLDGENGTAGSGTGGGSAGTGGTGVNFGADGGGGGGGGGAGSSYVIQNKDFI